MRVNVKYLTLVLLIVSLFLTGCEKKEEKKEVSAKPSEIKITEGVVKEKKAEKKEIDKGQFYYSYKEAQKEEAIEDEAAYTKLGAYRRVRSPYEKVQISLLASKLSKDFLIYCSACHDDYANGIIGPSLLDKSGDFIYKQLQDFKNEKRDNVLMIQLVKRLSDEKLKALADEIAAFNEKIRKLRAGEKVE